MASFWIGKRADGTALEVPPASLLRHAVALGASGSGKTVAMKALCEEAARFGVPVIALDPQGDLASLGLMGDREKVLAKGVPAEVYDAYAERREVVVWTPASTDGVPLSVNPLRGRFEGADDETVTKALSAQAEAIASLLELSGKTAVAFLTLVLEYLHRERVELRDFGELARFIDKMPRKLQEEVQELATPSLMESIEQQLRAATVGARGLLFHLGPPIDIDVLLGRSEGTPGKTRISVIYLNTLESQEEKDFFVQMLVTALYQWMLKHPSDQLQALFYVDEIAPFLPPVRKPACKEALQLLFKQARKFGIGCLAATQNPGDLDYKVLSQVNAWNLGRVLVRQDLKKVEKFFQAIAPVNAARIMKKLPALQQGEFQLLAPDLFEEVVEFRVRWLSSDHRTLEASELDRVNDAALKQRLAGAAGEPAREAPAPEDEEELEPETVLDEVASPDAGPPVRAEEAGDEPDEAIEAVRGALSKGPRAMTRRELCDETHLGQSRVDRAIERLERDGLVRRFEVGRAHSFAWHAFNLRPDLGLLGPVERFLPKVYEGAARDLAEAALETSFFVKQERIAEGRFFHFPLAKVHVRAEKKTGWIFRETQEGTENLYLHPRTCDIVHCGGGSIEFRAIAEASPLDLVDLDHVAKLEPAQPGELELRPEDFARLLPFPEIAQRAARKSPMQVLSVSWAFLPCWGFVFERKEGARRRSFVVDAVLGREVRL
jgi:hypothetical protein